MAGEWPIKTIAECASLEPYSTQIGPFGKALMSDQYTGTGVPVLRGVNVNQGRFHDDDFVFIDDETANRLQKFESFPDDVLLVHKGTLGQIGIMPKERKYSRYIMGNSMMRVRCNRQKLLPLYLYYWLTSSGGQQYIFSRVSQVGVPQIQTPLTTLREAKLPVPPLNIQSAIVEILGTLDDKIELNRNLNETLESMARALFKSWFIDFDPVRAKMDRWKKGHSLPGLPAELFDLFPGTLMEEAAGVMPAGWVSCSLHTCARFVNGASFKATDFNPDRHGHPVVKIGELKSGIDAQTKWSMRELSPDQTIHSRDLLYSWSGSPETSLEAFIWIGPQGLLNQHIFKVVTENGAQKAFVFYLLKELRGVLVEIAKNKQTTGLGHVTVQDMKQIFIAMPPPETIQRLCAPLVHFFDRYISNLEESQSLATLRDSLLPKLVSGDLRITNVDGFLRERSL